MSTEVALQNKTMLGERYEIRGVLGENGLSVTYKVYDTFREKNYVIKELFPQTLVRRSQDDKLSVEIKKVSYEELFSQMMEHVIRQAKELIKLFPLEGVANIISFFEENHTVYVVSEYIDGKPLSKYLKQRENEKLQLGSILHFFSPMSDSLKVLHEHHIFHGKIRPDQIMITKKNGVKLVGFCDPMVDLVHPVFKDDVFSARDSRYSSVEQFMHGGVQGSFTDVYGLAATIYHCITRSEPMDFYDRIGKKDRMQTPIELGADISIKQNTAIMKGLAPYDFERYQTIDEFLSDIYLGAEDENFANAKPIIVYQPPFKFLFKQRIKRILITGAAVLAIVFVFLFCSNVFDVAQKARVSFFYKKFAKESVYEQCETLKWLSKAKRKEYTNDYTQLGEEELQKVYYDVKQKKLVDRKAFENRGKLFEFIEINYKENNFAIVVFYDREATRTMTVDLNNLGEAYHVTERTDRVGMGPSVRNLEVDENTVDMSN